MGDDGVGSGGLGLMLSFGVVEILDFQEAGTWLRQSGSRPMHEPSRSDWPMLVGLTDAGISKDLTIKVSIC